jgi:hypothetical protein
LTPAEAIAWVQQQEAVALTSAPWAKEALTIVVVGADLVGLLAQVMPGAFAGVEGGAVVVCHWVVSAEGVREPVRWHVAAVDDEFAAISGPHVGRFPFQQAQELTS